MITVVLFFLINFGLWEILVAKGMNQSWASFTVYSSMIMHALINLPGAMMMLVGAI